eukprot:768043-Hanusia_phi.AAC.5
MPVPSSTLPPPRPTSPRPSSTLPLHSLMIPQTRLHCCPPVRAAVSRARSQLLSSPRSPPPEWHTSPAHTLSPVLLVPHSRTYLLVSCVPLCCLKPSISAFLPLPPPPPPPPPPHPRSFRQTGADEVRRSWSRWRGLSRERELTDEGGCSLG